MKVLVTGATGFVGTAVVERLRGPGQYELVGLVRRQSAVLPAGVSWVVAPEWSGPVLAEALRGVDAVVHLAAYTHVPGNGSAAQLAEFRQVNVNLTADLAAQAARTGVRRFVFMSSVKVHGEEGVFSETDAPAPADAYGLSKQEAEIALRDIAGQTGMAHTIVRSPLVYGSGVKANFRALMRVAFSGVPLPLGSVRNRRSLVAVENLAHFVETCLNHEAAARETFLVSDDDDLSTTDLIRRMAASAGRRTRLFSLPPSVLLAGAAVMGKSAAARRLLGSLQVDISKAKRLLHWSPPLTVDEGLRRTAAGFLAGSSQSVKKPGHR